MDCQEFREHIGADPAQWHEACAAHERSCAACAAYARRLRASERLIAAALRFDVAALRARRARVPAARVAFAPRALAAAASVAVAAVAVWLGLTFIPTQDPARLAEVVQNHWYHEPESWVRSEAPVPASVLDAVLDEDARIDLERLRVVSYARSCLVNGRWVPHLVVQGRAGPVMVLLLPRDTLAEAVPLGLPDEGLRGVIVPLGQGSVAILAEEEEPLEALRREVVQSVEWAT